MSAEGQSAICGYTADKIVLRGYDITELMEKANYVDAVFLAIFGKLPTKSESRVVNAILVSSIDHAVVPCTLAARLAIEGAPEAFQGAVAAGILTLGDLHGGAGEQCAKMLQEGVKRAKEEGKPLAKVAEEIVRKRWVEGQVIHGIGHAIHRRVDPRAVRLYEIVEREGVKGDHCRLLELIRDTSMKMYGKNLPINVDGAIGAVISDLGIDWRLGKAFFIMSRIGGIVAHIYEAQGPSGPAMRRYFLKTRENVKYTGPESQKIE